MRTLPVLLDRLQKARELGAEPVNFDEADPVAFLKDAPSQVAEWAVKSLAKAGTLSVIGVYPQTMTRFPIGAAMMKNLTLQMGNCPHRKYIPQLIELNSCS